MFSKITLVALLFGLSLAVPIEYHHEDEHGDDAHYEFEYSVHDEHTGDIKDQKESRKGDVVEGQYSLVEPDGHKRIVTYSANHHDGFQAHVEREGTSHHIPESHHDVSHHHVAPVTYAHHIAPVAIAHHHVAPVAVAHHVAHVAHVAPVAHVSHVAHVAPVAVAHHVHPVAIAHHSIPVHEHYATSHANIKQTHSSGYHH